MKKLFLSLLALVAMVVTANAQRAWAYDLSLTSESESYTFTFKATTAATATLILSDEEGNNVGTLDLGAVVAGSNTFTYTTDQLPKAGKMNWAVKLAGEAIAAGATLSRVPDKEGESYDFYMPQDVAVDNNFESAFFGNIYVAQATAGGTGGYNTRGTKMKAGVYVYNQMLHELNPDSLVGYVPSNVTLDQSAQTVTTAKTTRNQMHRLAVNPLTNDVAFAYNISGSTAVWSMNPENLNGSAVNLLAGVSSISAANSLCFDEEGALYVLCGADGGVITKIVNGEATQFAKNTLWANADNSLASDGKGGLWVGQNRYGVDANNVLTHVNSNGESDFAVNSSSSDEIKAWFSNANGNASYRGQIAYDPARQILAFGGNKKVSLFRVSYDENEVPTIEYWLSTTTIGTNIDGLAFDYAGDLYVVSASAERLYKYAVPTNNNTCITPAPKAQVIINSDEVVLYTITATANDAAMGTVEGAGKYYEGETVTLKATPKTGHEFVDWSNGATEATLTFAAEKDSAVVANFQKISYAVTVIVNDELKGTISGTGTYKYGETANLEAVAAEGYELLYWSDRSTENPRTITVDGNKVLNAYFVKEYDKEPTFTVEKVWENTNVPAATGNGYQAVGWDGKIYMQDAGNSKIMSYANGTDAAVEYAASGVGQQIAIDEAGNLIVFNAYFATSTPNNILIYAKGSTEGKAVSFTLPNPGQCHFFTASGDIYSAEGGYVYFYCQNTTVVNRVKITNGAATAANITVDVVGGSIYNGNTQNHVMVDIFGNLAAHSRSNGVSSINVHNNASSKTFAATLSGIKLSTLGGCTFELGGKEFWAYNVGTTHYNSEWNIYNMTDGIFLSDTVFYAKNKTDKNSAANWLNVQVVDEKTAYIYQFCPKVAVAVWKVTCDTGEEPGTGTAVDNTTVAPQVQKIVRDGQVLIIRDGKTFNMMGQEVR